MGSNTQETSFEQPSIEFLYADYSGSSSMMSVNTIQTDALVACVLIGLTGLVGVVGSLIMLRALFKYRHLRVNMYVLMGGLAVADLFHLVIAVPSYVFDLSRQVQLLSNSWCKFSEYFKSVTSYSVAFHLVGLAMLRGIMRTKRGYTPTNCRLGTGMTLLCWTLAVLSSVPTAVIFTYNEHFEACQASTEWSLYQEKWAKALFSCFLPLLFTIVIFAFTHYITKRYFADSYSRKERRISRLVTAVIIAFAICTLPFFILDLYLDHFAKNNGPEKIFEVSNLLYLKDYFICLTVLDKALRPVLYSKLAPNLNKCFDEVINCTMCSRQYATRTRRKRHPAGSQNSRLPLTISTNPTGIAETPSETL